MGTTANARTPVARRKLVAIATIGGNATTGSHLEAGLANGTEPAYCLLMETKLSEATLLAGLAEEARVDDLREALSAAVFQLEGPVNVMASVLATMERRGCCHGAGVALHEALAAARAAVDTLRAAIPEHRWEAPTAVNLNEIVRDVLQLSTPRLLATGVTVTFRPEPVLHLVAGYPNRLRAMIKALVDNAVEATNGRGWKERELTLATAAVDVDIEIVVEDSGPGIPPELRIKVFEPFYSTRKDGGHLGTGLAVARQVALDHCGGIEIGPREGGGCRVRVTLPVRNTVGDGEP